MYPRVVVAAESQETVKSDNIKSKKATDGAATAALSSKATAFKRPISKTTPNQANESLALSKGEGTDVSRSPKAPSKSHHDFFGRK
jgi:hypothetical protein